MNKIYKNNSLAEQGITTQEDLQKRLQEIFEQADHQNCVPPASLRDLVFLE